MKKAFFIITLLSVAFSSSSQSKKIVGSWILRDSIEAMQFFIKPDGTIQQRSGLASEDIWNKAQRTGTYIFGDNGKLVITWSDKSIEKREVKFEDNFKVAKINFTDRKHKFKKTYLFIRIVDEEASSDK